MTTHIISLSAESRSFALALTNELGLSGIGALARCIAIAVARDPFTYWLIYNSALEHSLDKYPGRRQRTCIYIPAREMADAVEASREQCGPEAMKGGASARCAAQGSGTVPHLIRVLIEACTAKAGLCEQYQDRVRYAVRDYGSLVRKPAPAWYRARAEAEAQAEVRAKQKRQQDYAEWQGSPSAFAIKPPVPVPAKDLLLPSVRKLLEDYAKARDIPESIALTSAFASSPDVIAFRVQRDGEAEVDAEMLVILDDEGPEDKYIATVMARPGPVPIRVDRRLGIMIKEDFNLRTIADAAGREIRYVSVDVDALM